MTSKAMNVYTDVVSSMLSGMTPEQVLAFKPTPALQQRALALVEALKDETITPDEQAELAHFREVDSLIRLAKANAYRHVKNG